MAIDPNDRLIGVNEVATILDVHPMTIHKKIGRINPRRYDPDFPQPIRTMGQRLKWRLSVIHRYIAMHERKARAA